jgi:hypothetical protein
MPSGHVNRTLGKASEKVPGLRRLPVVKLLFLAEIAVLTKDHYQRLSAAERKRLLALVRTGRGRKNRLSGSERAELEGLVAKLEPRRLVGDTVDRLSPVPFPKRFLYGKRTRH